MGKLVRLFEEYKQNGCSKEEAKALLKDVKAWLKEIKANGTKVKAKEVKRLKKDIEVFIDQKEYKQQLDTKEEGNLLENHKIYKEFVELKNGTPTDADIVDWLERCRDFKEKVKDAGDKKLIKAVEQFCDEAIKWIEEYEEQDVNYYKVDAVTLKRLLERDLILSNLEVAGVRDWEGYDDDIDGVDRLLQAFDVIDAIDDFADAIGEATPTEQLNLPTKGKVAEIDPIFGSVKHKRKNKKTVVIDADTIAYIACLQTEQATTLPDKKKKRKKLEEQGATFDDANAYLPNVKDALIEFKQKVDSIQKITGCEKVVVALTGDSNFRYDLYPDYKAHRKDKRRPAGLKELQELIKDNYETLYDDRFEADELVVAYAKRYKATVASVDKDVLNQVAGEHLNFYINKRKDAEWVKVTAIEANTYKFKQGIIGDSTDNIKGLEVVGEKGVEKIFAECKTQADYLKAYIDAYKEKMGDSEETYNYMALQLNLVDMQILEYKDDELVLKLWQPSKSGNLYKREVKDATA